MVESRIANKKAASALSRTGTIPSSEALPTGLELAPKPYLKGKFIDCDETESGTFRARLAVKKRDLYELVRLFVVQGATAWVVPSRYWQHIAYACAAIGVWFHPKRTAHNTSIIHSIVGDRKNQPAAIEIERGFFAGRLEERFQYLRSHRPGGWDPVIRIHGAEHVEEAVSGGQGIIFWGGNMSFNDLIAKIAFHRLGLETYHYTRPVHGLSNSRFGIRFLNPVRTTVEMRYLGARVCAEEKIPQAMEILRETVRAGGSTSIKTGNRGRYRATAPFLGGQIELATGPAALAKRWNAALLPVFTLRAPDGTFDVTIGECLTSDHTDMGLYCADIVAQYAEQLEPHFLADPKQWRGWRLMLPKGAGERAPRHSAAP